MRRFKSWPLLIRIILVIILLPFILMGVLFYLVWEKTEFDKNLKVIVSLFILFLFIPFGRNYNNIFTNSFNNLSNPKTNVSMEKGNDDKVRTPPILSDKSSNDKRTETIPIIEKEIEKQDSNDFAALVSNTESYLLLLEGIAKSYPEGIIEQELEIKLENEKILHLVESVLDYRSNNNYEVQPEFASSFSEFWVVDSTEKYPQVYQFLKEAFEFTFVYSDGNWLSCLVPLEFEEPILEIKETWLPASGRIYTGVKLYYGQGEEKMYVGEVVTIDNKRKNEITGQIFRAVFIKMASGSYEWKDREAIISGLWYVRSDDPYLN